MSTGGASAGLPAPIARGPGFQPEVVDELGGIKADKHAAGAAAVDDVVVAVFAWLVDAPFRLAVHIGEGSCISRRS